MGEKTNRFNLCLLLVLIAAGCSHQKFTHVNVYAENQNNQEAGNAFFILEGKGAQEQTEDQRLQFRKYVEKALGLNGLKKTDDLEGAEVVIILSYGSGPPSEHDLLTTELDDHTSIVRMAERTYVRKEKVTTYLRYLIIGAVDFREYAKTGKIKQLWRVTATHVGKNDKLNKIFPYLVAASQPYLGKHVPEKVSVPLSREDVMLMKIKEAAEGGTSQNESHGMQ